MVNNGSVGGGVEVTVFVKYTSIIWQDGGSTPTFVCVPALFMSVLISQYCVALHLRGRGGRAAEPAGKKENEKKRGTGGQLARKTRTKNRLLT